MNRILIFISFFIGLISCSPDYPSGSGNPDPVQGDSVIIGNQVWMSKNLDVSTYKNGDTIPEVEYNDDWQNLTTGAWCYYLNDEEEGERYGKLYNWHAVTDIRGLAPEGFSIPNEEDINQLYNSLCNNTKNCGGGLKSKSTLWSSPNTGATNKTGFNALPGGFRDQSGEFSSIGKSAVFWTSFQGNDNVAQVIKLVYDSDLFERDFELKGSAFSVRCIKK
jgi:uncharacterized protein (TIGR02145 family)